MPEIAVEQPFRGRDEDLFTVGRPGRPVREETEYLADVPLPIGLTTPDAADSDGALNPGSIYPDWPQTIAARSVIPLALYRPGRTASRISCPLLAVISTRDQTVLAAPALKAARRARAGEILQVDGTHYATFLDQHQTVVAAELDFLRRLLHDGPGDSHADLA
jgi:fermentation-respiration switch protein FrsA (DUF1100 family)